MGLRKLQYNYYLRGLQVECKVTIKNFDLKKPFDQRILPQTNRLHKLTPVFNSMYFGNLYLYMWIELKALKLGQLISEFTF